MREKTQKLIVTFHTTAAAMAMELRCMAQGIPGRVLPVPREISADCGMCWCSPVQERERIAAELRASGIEIEGVYEMLL